MNSLRRHPFILVVKIHFKGEIVNFFLALPLFCGNYDYVNLTRNIALADSSIACISLISLVNRVFFWICRNYPKIIEALSVDGSCGQHIESSNTDQLSGALFCSSMMFSFVLYFLP